MNKLFLVAALMVPAFAQDARQIMLDVQKRQHSDSQRYEGTLEVTAGDNQPTTKRLDRISML